MHYDAHMHDQMRRDTEATVSAALALAHAEVERALAQAHESGLTQAQRELICKQIAEAKAALHNQATQMAMAQARAALDSPEVRQAMDQARRTSREEINRAMAQAREEMAKAAEEARREADRDRDDSH
jgi:hypothetical protein